MSNTATICIVDYGVGNLYSAVKAFKKFTPHVIVSEDAADIAKASAVVLPGVGAFEAGMNGLKIRGLVKALQDFTESGKPMLGICLGAQVMFDAGYEFGMHEGLGIISGEVVPFSNLNQGTKIPQIGWNELSMREDQAWEETILEGLLDKKDNVYFVHSFIFKPKHKENVLAETIYGGKEFCSVFKKGAIYGCQFHPEKSGEVGLLIIQNFIHLVS